MSEWEVGRITGRCCVTGREFAEGDAYYAVLLETPEGFERRDYSDQGWTGPPEGSFCHWRGRIAPREKKPTLIAVDQGVLINLFLRLEDDASLMKQQFRFVLALLLMRKRLLRFEQTVHNADREYWQMRLVKEQSLHQVINPRLTDLEVDRLQAQLTAILSGDPIAIDAMEQPHDPDTIDEPAGGPPADATEEAHETSQP